MREWLKEARLARKLTQKQMADVVGVTEAYYSLIESGDRQKKIDLTLALRLGTALGLSIDEVAKLEEANNDK